MISRRFDIRAILRFLTEIDKWDEGVGGSRKELLGSTFSSSSTCLLFCLSLSDVFVEVSLFLPIHLYGFQKSENVGMRFLIFE